MINKAKLRSKPLDSDCKADHYCRYCGTKLPEVKNDKLICGFKRVKSLD